MPVGKLLKGCGFAFVFLAGALASGCASVPDVTTGAFTQVDRIDTALKRGVSTKMDVQKVLGAPNGFGSSVMPGDPETREIWFYDDVELTDYHSEGGGVFRMNVRQQILLVFFKKEAFDGFMWYSTKTVRQR